MRPEESLALLVPTKGRAEGLEAMAKALQAGLAKPEAVWLCLFGDEHDDATRAFAERWTKAGHPMPVVGLFEADPIHHGERFNRLRQHLGGQVGLYMFASDKLRVNTPGWDEVVRRSYRATPDRLLLTHLLDRVNRGAFGPYLIVSEAWVEVTGQLAPAIFPYWFDDSWLNEVARLAGRLRPLPIDAEMSFGRTQRMFNLRFWNLVYHASFHLRLAQAERLVEAIHAQEPPALELAKRRLAEEAKLWVATAARWEDSSAAVGQLEGAASARCVGPNPIPLPDDPYWACEAEACALLTTWEAHHQARGEVTLARLARLALAHRSSEATRLEQALRLALELGLEREADAAWAQAQERFPWFPGPHRLLWAHHLAQGEPQVAQGWADAGQARWPGMDWRQPSDQAVALPGQA